MLNKIKDNVLKVIDLIYPQACLHCANNLVEGEEFLCVTCHLDLPLVPWKNGHCPSVANQLKGKMLFEQTYSHLFYFKNGKTGKLLKHIKYRGNLKLAHYLGAQFGKSILENNTNINYDYIVPIPLHPKRLLKRGYNQAEEIAKGMSSVLKIPIKVDAIKRVRHNKSQTKIGRQDRINATKGLFEAVDIEIFKGKHILILDDVITTGATLEGLFYALESYGSVKISVAALCSPYD